MLKNGISRDSNSISRNPFLIEDAQNKRKSSSDSDNNCDTIKEVKPKSSYLPSSVSNKTASGKTTPVETASSVTASVQSKSAGNLANNHSEKYERPSETIKSNSNSKITKEEVSLKIEAAVCHTGENMQKHNKMQQKSSTVQQKKISQEHLSRQAIGSSHAKNLHNANVHQKQQETTTHRTSSLDSNSLAAASSLASDTEESDIARGKKN